MSSGERRRMRKTFGLTLSTLCQHFIDEADPGEFEAAAILENRKGSVHRPARYALKTTRSDCKTKIRSSPP